MAFVFGSFCTFCFHMLMYLFDEKCVLFPKLLSLTSLRHNVIYEFIPIDKETADSKSFLILLPAPYYTPIPTQIHYKSYLTAPYAHRQYQSLWHYWTWDSNLHTRIRTSTLSRLQCYLWPDFMTWFDFITSQAKDPGYTYSLRKLACIDTCHKLDGMDKQTVFRNILYQLTNLEFIESIECICYK